MPRSFLFHSIATCRAFGTACLISSRRLVARAAALSEMPVMLPPGWTGTLHVGARPKTLVDDGERHVVVLTIWDADVESKVYWRFAGWKRPQDNDYTRQRHPDLSNGWRVQARGYRRTKSGIRIGIRFAWAEEIKSFNPSTTRPQPPK
jgi:hypothetical protein